MKKFSTHLQEAKKSTVVISFGRMNPMTNGHEKLANKIKSEAASRKADAKLFLSHSTNPKKDPLPFDAKVKFAQKAFGPMVQHSAARTIIEVAKELTGKYSNLVVVVGSDRIPEFKTLLDKYNGKDFTFDSIDIISAGERDPDAEGVEGMSGSKMRKFAADGDFAKFKQGVPSKLSDEDAQSLFDEVRKGMKLDEEVSVDEGIVDTIKAKLKSKVKSSIKSAAHGALNAFASTSPVLHAGTKSVRKAIDNKLKEDVDQTGDLDEAVLSLSQRIKRGMQFRRMQTRIQRARMIAMRRFADAAHLKSRARRAARNALRKRMSPGTSYDAMATGQKIAVDKKLEKMKSAVGKIATRLLPTVRKKEFDRKLSMVKNKVESFDVSTDDINSKFGEMFTEAKNLNKLDQLIRYGLADKNMLSTIKLAVTKLGTGDTLNPAERKATEALVGTLVDIVTSSDQLFRLTKTQLQKEDIVLTKSYIKEDDAYGSYETEAPESESEDDVEMDGIHMARLELSAIIEDADEILSMLDTAEEEPDAWISAKISLAADYLATARDFLEYYSEGEEEPEEDDTNEYDDEDFGVEEAVMKMTQEELGESYEEIKALFEEVDGLQKKSEKSNIPYSILKQVYNRGIESYQESGNQSMTESQWAYARVNLFITGGKTDVDLWETYQKNKSFEQFTEALEWGTDAARMAYARATPGQSQEIIDAKYSADTALQAINNANTQRLHKLYSEEACCDECKDEIVEEVDWDLVLHEAQYQGKDVKLNDPFRTPDGPKKFGVYTMGPNGNVVIVRFGDPNMEIKRDDPERRASFRARHNCDDPGPKWKAKYWSCHQWRAGAKVDN